MRNFAKLIVMLAFLAVVIGCVTEETYYMVEPEPTMDARIVGTIHGVVRDGANNALLPDVEVQLTRGNNLLVRRTSSAGHYSFGDLVPGRYTLTFVFPNAEGKTVAEAYAAGVNRQRVPDWDELGFDYWDWPWATDRDFHYEIVCDMKLFPLTGSAEGWVYHQDMTPASGVTVVADFANQFLAVNQFETVTDANGRYTFSDLPAGMESCGSPDYEGGKSLPGDGDDDTWGHWGELEGCFEGTLRSRTFMHEGHTLIADPVELDLQWGGTYQADDLILRTAHAPRIVMRNFGDFDPDDPTYFPVNGQFVMQFNVDMNHEAFVVELKQYGHPQVLIPTEQSWLGDRILTVIPDHLLPGNNYTLLLSGHSVSGHYFEQEFYVMTTGSLSPVVVYKNFWEDIPFPIDGHFVLHFNTIMRDDESFVVQLWSYYDDELVETTHELAGNALTVWPVEPLELDQQYNLVVRGYSLGGAVFTGEYTVRTLQPLQPMVIAKNFYDWIYEEQVPFAHAMFELDFNMAMDEDHFLVWLHQGTSTSGALVPVEVAYHGEHMRLSVHPEVPLAEQADYYLRVKGHSESGFDWSQAWRIRTAPASWQRPVATLENIQPVALMPELMVAFTMPMDPETVTVTFVRTVGSVPVFFTHEWDDEYTLHVTPIHSLIADTSYRLTVEGSSTYDTELNPNPTNLTFTTISDGAVRVIAYNLHDYFPLNGQPEVTFSTMMDEESFTTTYGGYITLTQSGVALEFEHEWSVGAHSNSVLTIEPADLFLPNKTLTLTLKGKSADGVDLTNNASGTVVTIGPYHTIQMDPPTVVATNVVSGEFQPYHRIEGDPVIINPPHLQFTFSKAMDIETVEFDLWRLVSVGPPLNVVRVTGPDLVWSAGNTVATFTPYVRLLPLQEYWLGIDGECVDGVTLDGGLYHTPPPAPLTYQYYYAFDTAGGLEFLRHEIYRVDGEYHNIPRDDPHLVLHFNAAEYGEVLDLDAPGTMVTLWNFGEMVIGDTPDTGYPKQVAIEIDQIADGVLELTPVQMPLEASTLYWIEYNLSTRLPGDSANSATVNVNSNDTSLHIFFITGPESLQSPVQIVENLELQVDWFANFNSGESGWPVHLAWDSDEEADGYYVYVRIGDDSDAKNDYLRVATFSHIDDVLRQDNAITLQTAPFATLYDTRASDTRYTPFEAGQELRFRVAAYNDLGEGEKSDKLEVTDVIGPFGGTFGNDTGDIDNFTGAESVWLTVQYTSNEYLDLTRDPLVHLHDGAGGAPPGTPAQFSFVPWEDLPEDWHVGLGIAWTDFDEQYDDNLDGTTTVLLVFRLLNGVNAQGTFVSIAPNGVYDTSGNGFFDAVPVSFEWPDLTPPGGTIGNQSRTAKNPYHVEVDWTFTFDITASEPLDRAHMETLVPVGQSFQQWLLTIVPGPEDLMGHGDITTVAWLENNSVIRFTVTVPHTPDGVPGEDFTGTVISFNTQDLWDPAGNNGASVVRTLTLTGGDPPPGFVFK